VYSSAPAASSPAASRTRAAARQTRAPGDSDGSPDRSFRAVLALALLVPGLLFVAAAAYDYQQIRQAARNRVLTTVDALAEHAQKVFETNQLVLNAVEERISGMSWEEIRGSESLHQYLVRLNAQMPQLESTFIVDPEGFIAASSRSFPMRRYDVRNRDYYRTVLEGNNDLYVSEPFKGQFAGTAAFTVSRPAKPPGMAGGLVGVTLSPGYFHRFYGTLAEPEINTIVGLIRSDGVILVREPELPAADKARRANGFLNPATNRLQTGLFEGPSRRDGHARIAALHEVAGFPVFAAYRVEARGYLRLWYEHIAVLALFALVLVLVLSTSARAAIGHARRERANLRALLAETSRREEAEEALRQLQKIEALGRLTGGVAHDFNNLLTAVMGSIELASKRVNDARVARLLDGALEAARRGARLTQQMLAFSRQQHVQLRVVAVNDTLRGMDDLLHRSITPQIRLQYALEEAAWPALADPTQLEVAVLNLAINARDAMPLGGTLALRTENLPAGAPRPAEIPAGDFVVVTVSDTGAGMPEDVRQRAVEPFFTTKPVGHGTGLGLSMVHGFARQAGGGIGIDSTPGEGTSVRIFLPRAARDAVAAPDPGSADATAAESVGPLDIVLVDDDDDVRKLTAEMLREQGHRVTQFESGPAAVAHVRGLGGALPDLLIIDYAMPGMNGGEVARALASGGTTLPMVFISGYTETDALQEWTSRGYLLLTKPFTLPRLAAAIAASVRPAGSDNLVKFPSGRSA
jgi:signal transduction histidine kinase/ActR/RegA family two-component response regulator